jgi:hypothetical protein
LEIVARLSRLAEAGYVDPRAITQVQIALNDTEGVIESVRRILGAIPRALFLKLGRELDPLRSNPQFAAMVARLEM